MQLLFIMLGLGITMAIWPGQFSGLGSKRHQGRLLELAMHRSRQVHRQADPSLIGRVLGGGVGHGMKG